MSETARPSLARWQRLAVAAAALGAAGIVVGALLDRRVFFQSYLVGWVFWLGLPLGCAAIAMTHGLTGGAWGVPLRRACEAAVRTLPVMLVLFVPLFFGLGELYVWTHAEARQHEPTLRHQAPYLNVGFFVGRWALYFALWLLGGALLVRWSRRQRRAGGRRAGVRLAGLSGAGLILYVFTMSFAGYDWILSLDPQWYSTVFGLLLVIGQVLASLCLLILLFVRALPEGPAGAADTPAGLPARRVLHDLGNLLLMAVAVWAYLAFSQFLIIYYGNVPEEVRWYVPRTHGPWGWVALGLIFLHFAAPLALLLSRWTKRNGALMAGLALGLGFLQWVDVEWLTAPSFGRRAWWPVGIDAAAALAIGGVWMAAFLYFLGRAEPEARPIREEGSHR